MGAPATVGVKVVGKWVGLFDGLIVGKCVGLRDGALVGEIVGLAIGVAVGTFDVGAVLGDSVGPVDGASVMHTPQARGHFNLAISRMLLEALLQACLRVLQSSGVKSGAVRQLLGGAVGSKLGFTIKEGGIVGSVVGAFVTHTPQVVGHFERIRSRASLSPEVQPA